MEYVFSAMLGVEEHFEDFEEAKEKYQYEWSGDLKLVEVLKVEK